MTEEELAKLEHYMDVGDQERLCAEIRRCWVWMEDRGKLITELFNRIDELKAELEALQKKSNVALALMECQRIVQQK